MIADLSIIRFRGCVGASLTWPTFDIKHKTSISHLQRRMKSKRKRSSFIKKINIQLFRSLINNDILVLVASDKIFRRRKGKRYWIFQTIKLSIVFEIRFQITKCIIKSLIGNHLFTNQSLTIDRSFCSVFHLQLRRKKGRRGIRNNKSKLSLPFPFVWSRSIRFRD